MTEVESLSTATKKRFVSPERTEIRNAKVIATSGFAAKVFVIGLFAACELPNSSFIYLDWAGWSAGVPLLRQPRHDLLRGCWQGVVVAENSMLADEIGCMPIDD